ncbi:hypothetical protein IKX73_00735 [Candidatus Saccharibacteria bacterium]|nr:hypothetical protein [Candidatus Saccharibacteria bacterium]
MAVKSKSKKMQIILVRWPVLVLTLALPLVDLALVCFFDFFLVFLVEGLLKVKYPRMAARMMMKAITTDRYFSGRMESQMMVPQTVRADKRKTK